MIHMQIRFETTFQLSASIVGQAYARKHVAAALSVCTVSHGFDSAIATPSETALMRSRSGTRARSTDGWLW